MKILKALVVVGVCWLGANNSFFIKSNWTGRCLDVKRQDGGKNGNRIILWDCNLNNRTNNNQQWKLVKLANGAYVIKSKWKDRCLDVKYQDGGKNESRIILWDCNLDVNQQWRLVNQ